VKYSRAISLMTAILGVLAAVLMWHADAIIGHGSPAPKNYMMKGGPDSRDRDAGCPGRGGGGPIWTGAGGDTVYASPDSRIRMFDSASPQTGEGHDMLVIDGLEPSDVHVVRQGPHLTICGVRAPLTITIFRQYCHGISDGVSWNNQIEEIDFPSAGEIWIADEVLASAPDHADIVDVARIEQEPVHKTLLQKYPDHWRVRPFSEALPSDGLSWLSCRRDMVPRVGDTAR
jgi:hypothetical protein